VRPLTQLLRRPRNLRCAGLLWLACFALSHPAAAQIAALDSITARSHSGQFIVTGRSQPSLLTASLRRTSVTNWIRLDPPLAAVSCERIKDAVLWQLNASDRWRGRVAVHLHPVRGPADGIRLTQNHFTDGWSYRLEVPDAVNPTNLVQSIVNVVLLEWANRTATDRAAEVPAWLALGVALEILNDRTLDLVLRTPDLAADKPRPREPARQGQLQSTLLPAHEFFAHGSPLTFDQLCWPPPDQFTEANAPAYRYSAQLFVHELLRLHNGRNCASQFLNQLGHCRNWQTAFLQAFEPHFSRLLDVDKWWELQVVAFQEKGIGTTWNPLESQRKLDECLHVPVQYWQGTNTDGPRGLLSLQSFLAQADPQRQSDWLPLKIRELEMLGLHLAPTFAPLAREYAQVLTTYQHRRQLGQNGGLTQYLDRKGLAQLVRTTSSHLDALDARRAAAPPPPNTAPRPALPGR
jgi:hypothetical protein